MEYNMKVLINALFVVCTVSVLGFVSGIPLTQNQLSQSDDTRPVFNFTDLHLFVTISAQKRYVDICWINAPAKSGDLVLLTRQEPKNFTKTLSGQYTLLANCDESEESAQIPIAGYTTKNYDGILSENEKLNETSNIYWVSSNGPKDIVAAIKPSRSAEWYTTGVPFDYNLSINVTTSTNCYGYWASYINDKGDILAVNCIKAYPSWMSEMSQIIGNLRLRDLFIPGTHDSGSVRLNFDPLLKETLLTKYALTQDDDIKGQLMHGARYLDLRVAYYRRLPGKFYLNHGITRHLRLDNAIEQIKDFVRDTNEIVILGFKEFPVGFGKNLKVHRLLVNYLTEQLGNLTVDPSVTWSATLNDIWSRKQNVILAYDHDETLYEFPQLLFPSVVQRWGNVQTWADLEEYLWEVNERDISRFSSRPVADMAELTPETWDILRDTFGGLRKMADRINWRVCKLYREKLAWRANIVAVDFIRGTNLMDLAIAINKQKKLS